jgi:hypothetical protein
MGSTERYWQHVRLSDGGRLQTRTIPWASSFFVTRLADLENATDRVIQRRLVALMQSDPAARADRLELPQLEEAAQPDQLTIAQLAACCLRCFVSHQIPQVCADLEHQFRTQTGLIKADLYSAVMEDVDPAQFGSTYKPLALRIVEQFDPEQSGLATWTRRLVRQHKPLNRVLEEEYGIYLASDWAILLRTKPERLQRAFTGWTSAEVQAATHILQAFHAVYRGDRLAQRNVAQQSVTQQNVAQRNVTQQSVTQQNLAQQIRTGGASAGQRCHSPSLDQLNRMIRHLQTQTSDSDSVPNWLPTTASGMLQKLQALAQNLRQKCVRADLSVDVEANQFLLDQPAMADATGPSGEQDAEQDTFLHNYRQAAQICLHQAVDQAIDRRLAYFRSKPSTQAKADDFLRAMLLFHVRGWSMKEIAPTVGWTEQFQVTRLLGLKELQADLYQIWLLLICEKLPSLLQTTLEPGELQPIQQQLTAFLTALHGYLNDQSTSRQRRTEPEVWREQLHQICQLFPLVATLSLLIEAELKAYRTETYSPTRSQSVTRLTRSQLSTCICTSLNHRAQLLDLTLPDAPPAPS